MIKTTERILKPDKVHNQSVLKIDSAAQSFQENRFIFECYMLNKNFFIDDVFKFINQHIGNVETAL